PEHCVARSAPSVAPALDARTPNAIHNIRLYPRLLLAAKSVVAARAEIRSGRGVSECPSGRIVANHVQIMTSVKKIVPAAPESNCKAVRRRRNRHLQFRNGLRRDRHADAGRRL